MKPFKIMLPAIGLAEPHHVQPVPRPAFSILRRRQQPVHILRIRSLIVLIRRRQPGQAEKQPPRQIPLGSPRRKPQALGRQLRLQISVNRTQRPLHRRHKRPPRLPLRHRQRARVNRPTANPIPQHRHFLSRQPRPAHRHLPRRNMLKQLTPGRIALNNNPSPHERLRRSHVEPARRPLPAMTLHALRRQQRAHIALKLRATQRGDTHSKNHRKFQDWHLNRIIFLI